MREVTRQTLNIWLDMCQHPENYCDYCGKLKKFCSCQREGIGWIAEKDKLTTIKNDLKGGESND